MKVLLLEGYVLHSFLKDLPQLHDFQIALLSWSSTFAITCIAFRHTRDGVNGTYSVQRKSNKLLLELTIFFTAGRNSLQNANIFVHIRIWIPPPLKSLLEWRIFSSTSWKYLLFEIRNNPRRNACKYWPSIVLWYCNIQREQLGFFECVERIIYRPFTNVSYHSKEGSWYMVDQKAAKSPPSLHAVQS